MSYSKILIIVIFGLGLIGALWGLNNYSKIKEKNMEDASSGVINYVAIGDSYTIGNGVSETGRWPNVLTKHFNEMGVPVKLVANPSVSGYSVQDAIDLELAVVKKIKPDFVTVLIGANDNFRDGGVDIYRSDLRQLLDELEASLGHKKILLITIPDYSVSPAGRSYGAGSEVSRGIEKYNEVIKGEAASRGLAVADIFPISQTLKTDDYFISDGLHPSGKGYKEWEKVISEEAIKLLK